MHQSISVGEVNIFYSNWCCGTKIRVLSPTCLMNSDSENLPDQFYSLDFLASNRQYTANGARYVQILGFPILMQELAKF